MLSLNVCRRIIKLVSAASQAILNAERACLRLGVYISQELVDEALSKDNKTFDFKALGSINVYSFV